METLLLSTGLVILLYNQARAPAAPSIVLATVTFFKLISTAMLAVIEVVGVIIEAALRVLEVWTIFVPVADKGA